MFNCSDDWFPLTTFPFLSLSVGSFAVFLRVGDDICRLGLLGGATAELLESNIFCSSSTLVKVGGVTELLFRLGRPGQFASISGSEIGTDMELG